MERPDDQQRSFAVWPGSPATFHTILDGVAAELRGDHDSRETIRSLAHVQTSYSLALAEATAAFVEQLALGTNRGAAQTTQTAQYLVECRNAARRAKRGIAQLQSAHDRGDVDATLTASATTVAQLRELVNTAAQNGHLG